jgi:hypothetical protein
LPQRPGGIFRARALYDRKTPITAADLIDYRVAPFYDAHEQIKFQLLHLSSNRERVT